jgi:hypothetical protein
LTGLVTTSGLTDITSSNSILTAFEGLQAQINDALIYLNYLSTLAGGGSGMRGA